MSESRVPSASTKFTAFAAISSSERPRTIPLKDAPRSYFADLIRQSAGCVVIMDFDGYRAFCRNESILRGWRHVVVFNTEGRPLPNGVFPDRVLQAATAEDALQVASERAVLLENQTFNKVFVLGAFPALLPFVSQVFLKTVYRTYDGEPFPKLTDFGKWFKTRCMDKTWVPGDKFYTALSRHWVSEIA